MDVESKLAELHDRGFCVLRAQYDRSLIDSCRKAFWPILLDYLGVHRDTPNRGPHRHFLPMPFAPPCFHPAFFFDTTVLSVIRGVMDARVVADQWGCDVPLQGSDFQAFHVDYQRPLFAESPDLALPAYMLAVSFGLVGITPAHGPVEIAPGTHRMSRVEAARVIESAEIRTELVPLQIGDVLIRHPWVLHREPQTRPTRRVPWSPFGTCADGMRTIAAKSIRSRAWFGSH